MNDKLQTACEQSSVELTVSPLRGCQPSKDFNCLMKLIEGSGRGLPGGNIPACLWRN
jgi:hypothetical protein